MPPMTAAAAEEWKQLFSAWQDRHTRAFNATRELVGEVDLHIVGVGIGINGGKIDFVEQLVKDELAALSALLAHSRKFAD